MRDVHSLPVSLQDYKKMVEVKKGVKKTGTGYYASSGDGLKKRKGKSASSFAGVILHETCVLY